jgi:hypothetical protein
MHYVVTFVVGAAVGGSVIGYLAYNYGKKVAAAVVAVKTAASTVAKA